MNTNANNPLLVKILRIGLFALAFMPLIIFKDFLSPFHVGKVLVFRSAIQILAVFYLILIIRDRKYLPPRTNLFWAISIFTLAFGLTTFTSVNIYQSFWGTLERMGGWYSFIHFWALFMMLTGIFKKKEDWIRLIEISLFVSLLSSVYGFLQKTEWSWVLGAGGRAKIFGTIGNPALFAGYVIIHVFLALMMFLRAKEKGWRKNSYLIIFLADAIAVLMTGVRGSVIALVVGLILFGLMYSFSLNSRLARKYTLIFAGVIVVVVAGLLILKDTDFVQNNSYLARYSDFSFKSFTVQTRFWAWQAGFDGFNDSTKAVFVGYGPENFNVPFARHFNPKFFRGIGSETLFDRAHNQFIEILITMGIVGFMAYLSIFFYAFRNIRKKELPTGYDVKERVLLRTGVFTALVAYIIHNSFIFDTSPNYLIFFFLLGFINFLQFEKKRESSSEIVHAPAKKALWPALAGGGALMTGVFFLIWTTAVTPAKANYTTTRAIVAGWANQHDESYELYKKALEYDTFSSYEIRNRFSQAMIDYIAPRKVDQKLAERLQKVIEVQQFNQRFNKKQNIDYLPYLYTSRAYILLGKSDPDSPYNDAALDSAQMALTVSPTFVRTHYEVAQAYLNKKDYNMAAESFKKAVELNPDVALSWWYLGLTVIEGGDPENGIPIVQEALARGYEYQKSQADLLRLVSIFLKLEDFKSVASFYQQLIKLAPKNPQYHASLALAYSRIGMINEAVIEAKTAVQLDADYEAEAREFVRSIGGKW